MFQKISLLSLPMAALLMCLPALADSGQKPNLNGTWQLDPAKSDGANQQANTRFTRVIEQDGTKIHMVETVSTSDGKQQSIEVRCNTLGQQCNVTGPGHEAHVSFWYNGPALVEMDTAVHGKDTVTKRRAKLSDDGKTLEVEVIPLVPPGKPHEKLVFVRQEQTVATVK